MKKLERVTFLLLTLLASYASTLILISLTGNLLSNQWMQRPEDEFSSAADGIEIFICLLLAILISWIFPAFINKRWLLRAPFVEVLSAHYAIGFVSSIILFLVVLLFGDKDVAIPSGAFIFPFAIQAITFSWLNRRWRRSMPRQTA